MTLYLRITVTWETPNFSFLLFVSLYNIIAYNIIKLMDNTINIAKLRLIIMILVTTVPKCPIIKAV